MAERYSCASASLARAEPIFATASHVRRWVLIEQGGPWGPDALVDSALGHELGARLRARGQTVGARVLLIRRHGRAGGAGARGSVFLAFTGSHGRWLRRLAVTHPADLLRYDWSPLARDEPFGGQPHDEPLYLVCTNGRHDTCCAEFGRPLAKALTVAHGEQVWEASHFGGDRFAGNLVCLPHGLYYGRVSPVAGPELADRYAAGLLDLEHLRGRSAYPFPVQAAEHFVRTTHGLRGVDALRLEAVARSAAGTTATFSGPLGRTFVGTVRAFQGAPVQLTCAGAGLQRPPRWTLVDLQG